MTVCTDSDAARGMIHRVGCDRVRHLQIRYLWHQQALREGHFVVVRCGTKENPSDLGAKVLEKEADKVHEHAGIRSYNHDKRSDRCSSFSADKQTASNIDGCCVIGSDHCTTT